VPETRDPKAATTVLVGLVGFLIVIVCVIMVQALWYGANEREFALKNYSAAPQELAQLRASQLAALNSYRWLNEKEGVVGIPIERAIELIVRELNREPQSTATAPAGERDVAPGP